MWRSYRLLREETVRADRARETATIAIVGTRQKSNFFLFARFKQNTSPYNVRAIATKRLI